jgi:hypothetical protein
MYKKTLDSPQKNQALRVKGIGEKQKWKPRGTNPGEGPGILFPLKDN